MHNVGYLLHTTLIVNFVRMHKIDLVIYNIITGKCVSHYGSTVTAVAYGFVFVPGSISGSCTCICPGNKVAFGGEGIVLLVMLLLLPVSVNAHGVGLDGIGWTVWALLVHTATRYLSRAAKSPRSTSPPPMDPAIIAVLSDGSSAEKKND